MSKTPIEPGDIRKGDSIRAEYTIDGGSEAHEHVANYDGDIWGRVGGTTHFLLNRPKPVVVLPTEVGHYLANGTELVTLHRNGEWMWNGDGSLSIIWSADDMRGLRSLTKLEPVAETAKRVLDALLAEAGEMLSDGTDLYTNLIVPSRHWTSVEAKFGVTP